MDHVDGGPSVNVVDGYVIALEKVALHGPNLYKAIKTCLSLDLKNPYAKY